MVVGGPKKFLNFSLCKTAKLKGTLYHVKWHISETAKQPLKQYTVIRIIIYTVYADVLM